MAKRLEDLLGDEDFQPSFEPGRPPQYSIAGDCLFSYFENVPSYGDRIDGIVTVFRALDDERIVGFVLKGLSGIVGVAQQYGLAIDGEKVGLQIALLASHLKAKPDPLSEASRQEVYDSLLQQTRAVVFDVPPAESR